MGSTNQMQEEISALRQELSDLRSQLEQRGDGAPKNRQTLTQPAASRRMALAGSAALAAGLIMPGRERAAAANGDPLILASDNEQGEADPRGTRLSYIGSAAPSGQSTAGPFDTNVFLVDDAQGQPDVVPVRPGASAYPAALAGYGKSIVQNGVYGFAGRDGFGVVASSTGGTGLLARGDRANLELFADGAAPTQRQDDHRAGEVLADSTGSLWVCVAGGTPGEWRQLAGADTAGSFHPVNASRVFDSRRDPVGRLASGDSTTVDLSSSRDPVTYEPYGPELVPTTARAASINITIVRPTSAGFIATSTTDSEGATASLLSWSSEATASNALNLSAAGQELPIMVGGGDGATTHLLVDVLGYWS